MSNAPNLDIPGIPLSAAAKICRVDVTTVRWWFAQNHIWLGQHDLPPKHPGATMFITARRVLQLAIGARLTISMSPATAFKAAWEFSDRGRDGGRPGLLSAEPTLLIIDPDTGAALCGWPGEQLKHVLEGFPVNPLVICQVDPIVTATMHGLVREKFLEADAAVEKITTLKKRGKRRA